MVFGHSLTLVPSGYTGRPMISQFVHSVSVEGWLSLLYACELSLSTPPSRPVPVHQLAQLPLYLPHACPPSSHPPNSPLLLVFGSRPEER